MVAYTYRMPAGVPGNVTRAEQSTIEAGLYDPTAPFPAYGLAMKTVNGKQQPIGAGDTAASVVAILVRPYPTTGSPAAGFNAGLGSAVPPTSGICNRMRRGYIMVLLGGTAPAVKDGQVYVRIAAAATGKPIGGFEAAADSTNTIAINATFTGPADAQGNTEIAYNL